MPLNSEDIEAVCGLVIDLCGVYLDESKSYLIESRLGDLVKRSGCASYVDLVRNIRYSGKAELRNAVINAITTNETLFFRDSTMFDALAQKILPDLIRSKSAPGAPKRIRIWSAACSTGQEPYSLAMMLSECLPDVHSWDAHILGTDISDDVVTRASRGWYPNHETARGLSPRRLERFFKPVQNGWQVTDALRSLVAFERKNLLEPFAMAGRFDIVICRNVAIYFIPESRRDLFQRLAATLVPGGLLFVGSQESLVELGPRFTPHTCGRAAFYRPTFQHA